MRPPPAVAKGLRLPGPTERSGKEHPIPGL
jgi:hypothetical protein